MFALMRSWGAAFSWTAMIEASMNTINFFIGS